jgi:hypothetical protein
MFRSAVAVCCSAVLIAPCAIASPQNSRAKLAAQTREGVTKVARTLTIVNWVGAINQKLGSAAAGRSLGDRWNPSETHWDHAVDDILDRVMARFDELHDAPEALERLELPYQNDLTEAQAKEVLALPADQRKQLDDFADTMTLAVQLLEHRSDLKVGSKEYQASLANLTGMTGLPTISDVPKLKLPEATVNAYRQSRSASADFYLTAMDGQLKLYAFDHSAELNGIVDKAAKAAAKAVQK